MKNTLFSIQGYPFHFFSRGKNSIFFLVMEGNELKKKNQFYIREEIIDDPSRARVKNFPNLKL